MYISKVNTLNRPMSQKNIHIPVLLTQILECFSPKIGESYLDLTAGYGGHAKAVAEKLGDEAKIKLVDRDVNAVDFLRQQFNQDNRVQIIQADFLSASQELASKGEGFDLILADIGVSSPHLDNPDRGFSFMNDGPLDMRMGSNKRF